MPRIAKPAKVKKLSHTLPLLSMISPMVVWLVAFLVVPRAYVVVVSFMTKGPYGTIKWAFSLDSYAGFANPVYAKVFGKSVEIAILTTIFSLILSYPVAMALSKMTGKKKMLFMVLLVLPFWINGLIRLNGWVNILRETGIVNDTLKLLGLGQIQFMFTDGAIVFGMVYSFLPFMVLPIHNSLSKIPPSLIEAAADLGAKKHRIFLRVILPMTVPGIFSGTIQTFIPSLGAFYISDIMGGGNTMLLGNLIKNQFTSARNWPAGAALSVALILFTLVVMKLYNRVGKIEDLV